MKCPFCDFTGNRSQLHRHLADSHLQMVQVHEADGSRMFYEVACTMCDFRLKHPVKPRWKAAGFLEAYRHEIALVAFDQLIYHLEVTHG